MRASRHIEIPPNEVREALGRVLSSRAFARSRRLRRLLELTVGWTLEGRADAIKEATIALEAYARPTSFDPRIDPIMRAEARRLRGWAIQQPWLFWLAPVAGALAGAWIYRFTQEGEEA